MKNLLFLMSLFLSFSLLLSCSDENDAIEYSYSDDSNTKQNVKSLLLDDSFNQDWENYDILKIFAASGNNEIRSPWSNGVVTTTIPEEVRKDIKKSDGWEIIGHTLNMTGSLGADRGTNYIFFYNKFTGIFKVFFYLDPAYNVLNNTAVWSINFNKTPDNLLNFVHSIGVENSTTYKGAINQVYSSNITSVSNGSMGLTNGWNAFVIEFAYDPNAISNMMTIIPMIGQNVNISLSGNFSAKTDGTFLMTQNTGNVLSKYISSASKFIGGGAGQVAEKIIGEGTISNLVEKAVTKEVNKKVNSFLGVFNTTTTTEGTLSLTTTGELTMSGQSSFIAAAISGPCQFPVSQELSSRLGAWSLERPIIVSVSPIAYYKEPGNGGGEEEHVYELSGNYSIATPSVIINPNIRPFISNLNISTELYYCGVFSSSKFRNPNVNHSYGKLNRSESYATGPKTTFYEDLSFDSFKEQYYIFLQNPNNIPNSIDITNPSQSGCIIAYGDGIANHHVVKVTVSFDTKIGGKVNRVVSTRTFVPQLEWM